MPPAPEAFETANLMADLAYAPANNKVTNVAHDAQKMSLHWDNGRVSNFSAMWLRENCPCPSCKHPQAMERLYMFIDHGKPVIEGVTQPTKDIVEVQFLQGPARHISRYSVHWLRQHCYSSAASKDAQQQRTLWDTGLNSELPTVDFKDYMGTPQGMRTWIESIKRYGVVLMQGVPTEPGKLLEVARRVGPVRQTNFGDHYDVISMPKPNAVAYTALGLELHLDLVNWRFPPDVQMLCCLKSNVTGGESIFADGFRVAADLRKQYPQAFKLLTEQPVEYRFHDTSCDIRTSAPMLTLDHEGNLVRMRFNNWLRSPLRVPEELMDPMYEAIASLWGLLRDPQYHLNLKLNPGELIAYDNNRILHGRKSFDPASGERHLQGCYMNMDDLDSALRLLERNQPSARAVDQSSAR